MAIEMSSDKVICHRCGQAYGGRKGFFTVCRAEQYRGIEFMHICKKCIDALYSTYLIQSNNPKDAMRQMCRKLDLYWSEPIYDSIFGRSTNKTIFAQYMSKINTKDYAGRCYDDTLIEEGTLWDFKNSSYKDEEVYEENQDDKAENSSEPTEEDKYEDITDDVIMFWGNGYPMSMYRELEQRRRYWMSRLPDEIDIGTEALVRQICSLELDINRDRAAGKSVDKNVNALNNLLGSANLKPTQKKDGADSATENTPFGVWIRKWETQRPIPEPDPELQDVDGIIKYILTWLYGHLAKMFNIKNARTQLYDDEINRLRVIHPEYEDEDDEDMLYDIFGNSSEESGGDSDGEE